jgi:hypothetical protein
MSSVIAQYTIHLPAIPQNQLLYCQQHRPLKQPTMEVATVGTVRIKLKCIQIFLLLYCSASAGGDGVDHASGNIGTLFLLLGSLR